MKSKARLPIAVVVLNWNGKALSEACLASWMKAKPAPSRILLVDNGSEDGSVARLKRRFPKVEVLALPANLGFAAGNNRGFEHLWRRGPKVQAVFVCNNDTEVEPAMLGRLWQALSDRPAWGAVGPRILFHGTQKAWFEGGRIRPISGRPMHLGYGREAGAPGEPFALPAEGFVTGCGLLVRADALRRLGGFDERLWAYAEDSDLCLRLAAQGLACGVVPAAVMSHKVSSTFQVGSPLSMYYITRNSMLLLRRHRLGMGALTRAGFLLVSLARAARALLMGRPAVAGAIWRGLNDAGDLA
jgi:GT2 family glycosyltransferase